MPSIVVLTHNGQPVSQGGKRVGYQVGSRVLLFAGPAAGLFQPIPAAAKESRPPEPKPQAKTEPAMGLDDYFDLPQFFRRPEICPYCNSSGVETVRLKVGGSYKDAYECRRCMSKMRPRTLTPLGYARN